MREQIKRAMMANVLGRRVWEFAKSSKKLARNLMFFRREYKSAENSVGWHKMLEELRYYWHDYVKFGIPMNWRTADRDFSRISSELIFQYHKLEKGMCLPPPKRFFGIAAVNATLGLMEEWRHRDLDTRHRIYIAALEVLKAYRSYIEKFPAPPETQADLLSRVSATLDLSPKTDSAAPYPPLLAPPNSPAFLRELAVARRSVRDYAAATVNFKSVESAFQTAMLSPSACNRQPWRVHFYEDKNKIAEMLKLQNGNTGFGHTIPLLAVIASESKSFFAVEERIEPILDAGLFLSTFLLALQAEGLSSCCLNWCASVENDAKAHMVGAIPETQQIMTFLAIGVKADGAVVARSERRPLTDCLIRH